MHQYTPRTRKSSHKKNNDVWLLLAKREDLPHTHINENC